MLPLSKKGLDKGLGFKGAQIVDPLADADVTNRQAKLLGQGKDHPALGGPIELSQCQAGQLDQQLDAQLPPAQRADAQRLLQQEQRLRGTLSRNPLDLQQVLQEGDREEKTL